MPTDLPAQHAAAPKPTVKNRFPRTDKYRCPAAPQHRRARFASDDSPSPASSSDAVLVAAAQHGEVLHKCIALATGTAPSAHQRVHQKETRARTIRGSSRAQRPSRLIAWLRCVANQRAPTLTALRSRTVPTFRATGLDKMRSRLAAS